MTFHWPQIVLVCASCVFGTLSISKQKTTRDRLVTVFAIIIADGFYGWILWCGGFFG